MLNFNDWPKLSGCIDSGMIGRYITKREAMVAAEKYHWPKSKVVRVQKRFEIIWIVADHSILFSTLVCPIGTDSKGNVSTIKFEKVK